MTSMEGSGTRTNYQRALITDATFHCRTCETGVGFQAEWFWVWTQIAHRCGGAGHTLKVELQDIRSARHVSNRGINRVQGTCFWNVLLVSTRAIHTLQLKIRFTCSPPWARCWTLTCSLRASYKTEHDKKIALIKASVYCMNTGKPYCITNIALSLIA